jgi:hypothetical protein
MGGIGSGTGRRKPVSLICKWEECAEAFIAKRKDAQFCCKSCENAYRVRQKLIESKEVLRCRICNLPVSVLDIYTHFKNNHPTVYKQLYSNIHIEGRVYSIEI